MQENQQLHGGTPCLAQPQGTQNAVQIASLWCPTPIACRVLLTLIRAGEGCGMLGGSCQHKSSPDSLDSRHGCCEAWVWSTQCHQVDVPYNLPDNWWPLVRARSFVWTVRGNSAVITKRILCCTTELQ